MMQVMKKLSPELKKQLLKFQQSERTEALVYQSLARQAKTDNNAKILNQIADDELRHAEFWKDAAGGDHIEANNFKAWVWALVAKVFGITFGLRLMEHGEENAQKIYMSIQDEVPGASNIAAEEQGHEQKLISLLDEKKLEYIGSVVLGLNDALVELTGALAGFSFAIQNTRVIALLGVITGVAATLSMAASEYLSNRADDNQNALTASIYTGIAYFITVAILVAPFIFFTNYLVALGTSLTSVVIIIASFTFYLSVAKNHKFWARFGEMTVISLGVAALSFGIGVAARLWLGIEV